MGPFKKDNALSYRWFAFMSVEVPTPTTAKHTGGPVKLVFGGLKALPVVF
jgi:hypothetical protein